MIMQKRKIDGTTHPYPAIHDGRVAVYHGAGMVHHLHAANGQRTRAFGVAKHTQQATGVG